MVSIGNTDRRAARRPFDAAALLSRPRLDGATLLGLAGAFGLMVGTMLLGGSLGAFLNLPSLAIVFGGTFAVTTICFSLAEIGRTQRVLMKTVFHSLPTPHDAAILLLRLSEQARQTGVLSLQAILPRFKSAPFLHKCLVLAVDGTPGEEIERVLRVEIDATHGRHFKSASVLRKAAEVAPAMGLIGTLVGLVQMLGHLSDPSAIGPSMAIALLTTFYGAILGSMVFSPLAAKLERNAGEEALLNRMYLMTSVAIGNRSHPGRLQLLLNTVLPPAEKVHVYE
ncbi:MAG: MotA/TolQ/ExbB proton channel family protein [Alphaproteobacteria bacterium]